VSYYPHPRFFIINLKKGDEACMKITTIFLCFLLSGCSSSTLMSAGGYDFVHFNDPECMGASASGVIMGKANTKEVVESSVAHKTGYCESLTGQAISVGGKVYGANQLRKGLSDSGNNNSVSGGVANQTGVADVPADDPGAVPQ
jgi:hypothetical protein